MRHCIPLCALLLLFAACGGGGSKTEADTVAPVITSLAASDSDGAGGPSTITVLASDDRGVASVIAVVEHADESAPSPVVLSHDSGDTWIGTVAMKEGDVDPTPFTVQVTVADAAGNEATDETSAEIPASPHLPPPSP